MKSKSTLVALSLLASVSMAHAAQGVTSDKITVGSLQDLSGPIAGFGKQIRFGMTLRMQEINEQGGCEIIEILELDLHSRLFRVLHEGAHQIFGLSGRLLSRELIRPIAIATPPR